MNLALHFKPLSAEAIAQADHDQWLAESPNRKKGDRMSKSFSLARVLPGHLLSIVLPNAHSRKSTNRFFRQYLQCQKSSLVVDQFAEWLAMAEEDSLDDLQSAVNQHPTAPQFLQGDAPVQQM